jgi:hypothetical protein
VELAKQEGWCELAEGALRRLQHDSTLNFCAGAVKVAGRSPPVRFNLTRVAVT